MDLRTQQQSLSSAVSPVALSATNRKNTRLPRSSLVNSTLKGGPRKTELRTKYYEKTKHLEEERKREIEERKINENYWKK